MIQKTTLSFLLLLCSTFLFAQDPGERMFDNSIVHEINFEFAESNYWSILNSNFDNHPDPLDPVPYLMATVIIDGETVDSVGVRFKGFTSAWASSTKKPFKIDFNEFVPGKKYDGLRKLNLNNSTGDASMQRDFICYDLHRSTGVKASRVSFSKVYINGEYWGLYQSVEQVDKEFLQKNFSNDNGNLFKNLGWSGLEWLGNNEGPYADIFSLKTNKTENDWSGFINLIDVINNTSNAEFKKEISAVFNVDLFLKVLAVDVATNNWDSYLEHQRNWYMYEDTQTGIFHWIPWDYNFSLDGGFSGGGCEIFPEFVEVPVGTPTVQFQNTSWSSNGAEFAWSFGDGGTSTEENPTHTYATAGTYNVCMSVDKGQNCNDQFCKTIDTNDNLNDCNSIINGTCPHPVGATFAKVVDFNPNCCDAWGNNCEDLYQFFTPSGGDNGFPIDQKENEGVLIERLLNVPEFYERYLAYFCELTNNHFTKEKYLTLVDDNKVLINDAVESDPNSLFTYNDFLYDIGDDGIKSIIEERIDQLAIDLNDQTTCMNLATIDPKDVVINELVASNDSTSMIADEAGEFDDWIELYNNTTEVLDLGGSYLSDDLDNLQQWQFPLGTTIDANEYLIVWADKDDTQPGLHASFKLGKSGDEVFLTNNDGTFIDSISFGEQTTNIAFARIPNGTGDFINQASTFKFNNEDASSTSDLFDQYQVDLSPVPATDFLQVNIQSDTEEDFSIDLFSITGQLLQQNIPTQSNQARLDLSDLSDGFYTLSLKNEQGHRRAIKFVVVK